MDSATRLEGEKHVLQGRFGRAGSTSHLQRLITRPERSLRGYGFSDRQIPHGLAKLRRPAGILAANHPGTASSLSPMAGCTFAASSIDPVDRLWTKKVTGRFDPDSKGGRRLGIRGPSGEILVHTKRSHFGGFVGMGVVGQEKGRRKETVDISATFFGGTRVEALRMMASRRLLIDLVFELLSGRLESADEMSTSNPL